MIVTLVKIIMIVTIIIVIMITIDYKLKTLDFLQMFICPLWVI